VREALEIAQKDKNKTLIRLLTSAAKLAEYNGALPIHHIKKRMEEHCSHVTNKAAAYMCEALTNIIIEVLGIAGDAALSVTSRRITDRMMNWALVSDEELLGLYKNVRPGEDTDKLVPKKKKRKERQSDGEQPAAKVLKTGDSADKSNSEKAAEY
jgi:histone H3/H4